jgi:cell division protein FtsN
LKALGREEPGVDLLADHADLKARVDNQEISRADALELANNRRANAARQQQDQSQQQQQRQTQQVQQTQQRRSRDSGMVRARPRPRTSTMQAREAKIEPQIAEIIAYPPNLWLPTIQRLYESISVTKAPVLNLNPALRPNGAKPGAKRPNTMLDAIRSGLKLSCRCWLVVSGVRLPRIPLT